MQIIVKLTTACNLGCVYCSEGDKSLQNLDKTLLYKLIDDLPQLLEKNGQKEIDLLWHGGEPLMVGKKYLVEAMEYAQAKLAQYRLSFLMQSNGTLIDDEWIEIFKRFKVGVGISLDGYKELHDCNRKTKNGDPTFETVLANINKMRAAGIEAGTLMVLNTEQPVDVDKLFSLICNEKLSPKIHPVIPCGRAATTSNATAIYDNYIELLKGLYKKAMESEENVFIEPLDGLMNAVLGSSAVTECSYAGTCGTKFLSVYPNGDVGFCGRSSIENVEFLYGNIGKESLAEMYDSKAADLIRARLAYLQENDCKNCSDWEYCHGGCSFEAANAFGTLQAKYPQCNGRKKLLSFLKTEGLVLLKKRFLRQKSTYRVLIKEKQRILEELKSGI